MFRNVVNTFSRRERRGRRGFIVNSLRTLRSLRETHFESFCRISQKVSTTFKRKLNMPNKIWMMKYLNLILITLITLASCSDDEITKSLECDKLTSREEAQNLMNQVNDEELTDSTQIVENLIGEWGLIGIVSEWFEFEAGQECIKLTIDSNEIKLEDMNADSTSTTEWELKQIESNGFTIFYLETDEEINHRMGMEIFSDNVMFGSGRWLDADMYIYEKLK